MKLDGACNLFYTPFPFKSRTPETMVSGISRVIDFWDHHIGVAVYISIPSGNQTWLAGKWTIEISEIFPLNHHFIPFSYGFPMIFLWQNEHQQHPGRPCVFVLRVSVQTAGNAAHTWLRPPWMDGFLEETHTKSMDCLARSTKQTEKPSNMVD